MRNPDERTRRAERAWKETGDPHAAAAWLTGLARQRELHGDPAGVLPALEELVRVVFQGLPFDPLVELIVARARSGRTMPIRWDHTLALADADEEEVDELTGGRLLWLRGIPFPGAEAVRWAQALTRQTGSDHPARPRLQEVTHNALLELGRPPIPANAVITFYQWGEEADLPAVLVNAAAQEGWSVFNEDEIQSADWNHELVDRLVREYIRAHGIWSPAPEYVAELLAEVDTDDMARWQVKQSAFLGYPHALGALYLLKLSNPAQYVRALEFDTDDPWGQVEVDLAVALLGGGPTGILV
jgi:hypothetical protein